MLRYNGIRYEIKTRNLKKWRFIFFTAALALGSRGLVIGSREEKEEKEEKEREEEEKNLQIAIRCLWDLFD